MAKALRERGMDAAHLKGMPGGKIAVTSRGEMDAKGTDEATWARDRRVDVVLAD